MNNNKLDLVFDLSNMSMRSLFTCTYAKQGDVTTFDTDEECGVLIRKIAMDMAYVIRIFNPDKVIVACDARNPWRHDLYKDIDNEGYKGNRQKDDTKNWTKIFESINEYKEILKQKNFIVSEIATAEADDLAALWKQYSFARGRSVVLVSSDKDWTQLVEFNKETSQFCIAFNPIANNKGKKKLYTTESFIEWINSENEKTDIFFNNYNSFKDTFKNIKTKDTKIEYEAINPDMVLLEKVLCGDDGDNVPSYYDYYNNGKKSRITPSRLKKICESLNVSTVAELEQATSANALTPVLLKMFKFKTEEELGIDTSARLLRQRKLVELNPVFFPSDICKTFSFHYSDNANFGSINNPSIKLDDILKGTKFLSENYKANKPKENGIFDNLKDLDKYIPGLNQVKSTSLF